MLAYFKGNQTTLEDFGKTAPPDIQADAQYLVNAVHAAISANDPSVSSSADVQAAGARVDSYCGQNSTGTEFTPTTVP